MSKRVLNVITAALVLNVLAGVVFVDLAFELRFNDQFAFDSAITAVVYERVTPLGIAVMKFVTKLGTVHFLALVTIAGASMAGLGQKRMGDALVFVVAAAGGGWLNDFLKWVFKRARPDIQPLIEIDSYSFPSGHAMGSIIVYGFIIYLLWKSRFSNQAKSMLTALFAILILLIGFSRIYLGVHYPSDVIAGYAAGFVWLCTCIFIWEWFPLKVYYFRRRNSD